MRQFFSISRFNHTRSVLLQKKYTPCIPLQITPISVLSALLVGTIAVSRSSSDNLKHRSSFLKMSLNSSKHCSGAVGRPIYIKFAGQINVRNLSVVKFNSIGICNNFKHRADLITIKDMGIGLSFSSWSFIISLLKNQKANSTYKNRSLVEYRLSLALYQSSLKNVYKNIFKIKNLASNIGLIVNSLTNSMGSNSLSILDRFIFPKLKDLPKGGYDIFSMNNYRLSIEKLILLGSMYRSLYFSKKYSSSLTNNIKSLKKFRNYLHSLFHSVSTKTINFYPYGGSAGRRNLTDTRSFSRKVGFQNFKIPVSIKENLNCNNVFYDSNFHNVLRNEMDNHLLNKGSKGSFIINTITSPQALNQFNISSRYFVNTLKTNHVLNVSTGLKYPFPTLPNNSSSRYLNNTTKNSTIKVLRLLAHSIAFHNNFSFQKITNTRLVGRLAVRSRKVYQSHLFKQKTKLFTMWSRVLFLLKKYQNYRNSTLTTAWKIRLSPREVSDKSLRITFNFSLFRKFLLAFSIPSRVKKYFLSRLNFSIKRKRKMLFKFPATRRPSLFKLRFYNSLPHRSKRKKFITIRFQRKLLNTINRGLGTKNKILLIRTVPETRNWLNARSEQKFLPTNLNRGARSRSISLFNNRPLRFYYKKNVSFRKFVKRVKRSVITPKVGFSDSLKPFYGKFAIKTNHLEFSKGPNNKDFFREVHSSFVSNYRSSYSFNIRCSSKISTRKLVNRSSCPGSSRRMSRTKLSSADAKVFALRNRSNSKLYRSKFGFLKNEINRQLLYRPLSAHNFLYPENFEFTEFTSDYAKLIRVLGGRFRIVSSLPHKFIGSYGLNWGENTANCFTSKINYLFNRSKSYISLVRKRRSAIKWSLLRLGFYNKNKNFILQNWISKTMTYHNQGFLKKKNILKKRALLVLNNKPQKIHPSSILDPIVGTYWGASFVSKINQRYRRTTLLGVNFGIEKYIVWKNISRYFFLEKNSRSFGNKKIKMPKGVPNEDFLAVKKSVLKTRYLLKNEIGILKDSFRASSLRFFYSKSKRSVYPSCVPYKFQIPDFRFAGRRFLQNGRRKLPFYWIRSRKKNFPLKHQKKNWVWSIGFWSSDERFHKERTTLYEGSISYQFGKFYSSFYRVIRNFSIEREMSLMLRFRKNKPFIFIPFVLRTQSLMRRFKKFEPVFGGFRVFGLIDSNTRKNIKSWVPRKDFNSIYKPAISLGLRYRAHRAELKFLHKVQVSTHSLLSLNLALGRMFRNMGSMVDFSPRYINASTVGMFGISSYRLLANKTLIFSYINPVSFIRHLHKNLLKVYATGMLKPSRSFKNSIQNLGPLGSAGSSILNLLLHSKSSSTTFPVHPAPFVSELVLASKVITIRSRAINPIAFISILDGRSTLCQQNVFKNKVLETRGRKLLFSNKFIRIVFSKKFALTHSIW